MANANDVVTRFIADDRSGPAVNAMSQRMSTFANTTRRGVELANTALASMAARFLATGAAITVVNKGWNDFAKIDTTLRRMSLSAGVTFQETQKLMPAFREWARQSGRGIQELMEAFEILREEGMLGTQEAAKNLFDTVVVAAKRADVSTTEMASGMATMMRNLKVTGEEIGEVMDMLIKGQDNYALRLKELIPQLPRLTEQMEHWGVTGKDRIAQTIAALSAMREATGNAGTAATLLTRAMGKINDPSITEKLGYTPRGLSQKLKDMGKEGHNVIFVFAQMLDEAIRLGKITEEELGGERIAVAMRTLVSQLGRMKERTDDIRKSADEAKRGYDLLTTGTEAGFQRFAADLDRIVTGLGAIADGMSKAFGTSERSALEQVAEVLESIAQSIEVIKDAKKENLYLPGWSELGGLIEWLKTLREKGSLNQDPSRPQTQEQLDEEKRINDNLKKLNERLDETRRTLEKLGGESSGGGGASSGGGAAAPGGGGSSFDDRFGTWQQQGGGSRPRIRGFERFFPRGGQRGGGTGTTPTQPSEGAAPGGGGFRSGGMGTLPGSSPVLAAERARFAEELRQDPALRGKLAGLVTLENEGAGTAVVESLMNRQAYTGGSIKSGIGEGNPRSFYGPVRRGALPGAVARLNRDPVRRAKVNKMIDDALGGSNVVKGYTDQGSAGDPNYVRGGVGININRERFNDWGGGPGGHAGARRFRENQQRRIMEFNANPENRLPPLPSTPPPGVEDMGPQSSIRDETIRVRFEPGLHSYARSSLRGAARRAFQDEWINSYSDVV